MSAPVEIICLSCQAVGAVNKVTAGLRCSCGSTELDLYEPGRESFLDFMGAAHGPGTGWGQTMPDALKGFNEYAGPMPGANPFSNHVTVQRCPVCHGSKIDIKDGGDCRECGGTGLFTPTTTSPAPLVKKHNYPSTQTGVPFVGSVNTNLSNAVITAAHPTPEEVIKASTPGYNNKSTVTPGPKSDAPFDPNRADTYYPKAPTRSPNIGTRPDKDYSQPPAGPYVMNEARCPNCGQGDTQLKLDHQDHAWWHCPNCGPLADIDGASAHVNPYDPPADFTRQKGFKAARKIGKSKKTGRVLKMLAQVHASNPGLTKREAVSLVVRTVSKYSE